MSQTRNASNSASSAWSWLSSLVKFEDRDRRAAQRDLLITTQSLLECQLIYITVASYDNRYGAELSIDTDSELNTYDEYVWQLACDKTQHDNLDWWNAGSTEDLREFKRLCRRRQLVHESYELIAKYVKNQQSFTVAEVDDMLNTIFLPTAHTRNVASDKDMELRMLQYGYHNVGRYRTDIKQIWDEITEDVNEKEPTSELRLRKPREDGL